MYLLHLNEASHQMLHCIYRKFQTFQDETGANPNNGPGIVGGEPGARILWTQDSSSDLLPNKFAMPA